MDLVLRGATVIDGTGSPGRPADVGVAGDRIVAVGGAGEVPTDGAEVVDLDGLVLAPGFVDVHTHYDAQVLWDPDLTPSSWHGVTTVVMGNCGFGIAPTRPEHREVIARTLENVEGMSLEALEAGIPWTFETFPEYLDAIDAVPRRLNIGAMVGHTPVRLYVMGEDASERAATGAEIEQMHDLVAEAIAAGAIGFATSKAPTHAGDAGKPVPSRLAEIDEVYRLADALGEAGRGIMQATIGTGLFVNELATIAERTGRPVSWTALLTGPNAFGDAYMQMLDMQKSLNADVWPQVSCRPLVFQVTLEDPFAFGTIPGFEDILAAPREQRIDVYRDPAWRDRVRPEIQKAWSHRWDKITIEETERHAALRNGPTLADLASERGVDAADLLIDLAVEDDLRTRYRVVLMNDDEEAIGALLNDERAVLGLSDAGAHASQLCDACFSTHLLSHWVRDRGDVSLELAVRRLTDHAAQVFKIPDRGRIAEGWFADLVAFDPATVGASELERVWDLPAGADRLVVHSTGIEHVWVNGQAVRRGGADIAGARPGHLLRGGAE